MESLTVFKQLTAAAAVINMNEELVENKMTDAVCNNHINLIVTDKDEIIADFLIFTTHRFLLDESNKLIQTEEGYRDYMLNALKAILPNNDGISIYSDSDSIHVVAYLNNKGELTTKDFS